MKKQLLTFMLVPALAFGAITAAPPKQALAASTSGQIVSSVSFRQSPDQNSSRIRYLKAGEQVTILEKTNNWWYKVQDSTGRVGYVSTSDKYIHASTSSQSSSSSQAASGNGRIVSSVNFHTEPNANSSRIRYLKTGETVQVLEKVNDWWYKVKASDGREGYISTSSKYIQTSGVASGGSSGGSSNSGSSSSNLSVSEKAQKVIAAGKKYLGTPYEYGSSRSNTSTFDCSDFVRQAFLDGIGLTLPSDSRAQGNYVKANGSTTTDWHNLKPGDLMFFMDYKGTSASAYSGVNKSKATISHVAIYLGDGKILHTYSKDSGGVRIDSIEGRHWEYRFLFGGSAM
ncbi:C40 family peptidase [Paenibacillus hexagrammi]|uniref:C40 family peptidase n=1 Tax=Paenibacillus hexagrammi TaxID=2908839 RepID=A0ABY3SDE3_9BACL|nr:SH3 domain-containing C40 family peptidase [Paenibacillus sp. YPD9-1]UJF31988.1 C40 family peptidase [Paenibacillus sp. YPD9-1]